MKTVTKMKFRLINLKTKETYLCDKITIDGFDYYVSDEKPIIGSYGYLEDADVLYKIYTFDATLKETKKVIASNNPNIEIPKVVNEVEMLAENHWKNQYIMALDESTKPYIIEDYKSGYIKSQETHPFSEKDMIEFAQWTKSNGDATKDLLEYWKQQQPKVIYIC